MSICCCFRSGPAFDDEPYMEMMDADSTVSNPTSSQDASSESSLYTSAQTLVDMVCV